MAGAVKAAAAGRPSGPAVERLAGLLLEADRRADLAREALRDLAAAPRAMIRLEELVRRILAEPPPDETLISLTLAACHADGRVREKAVTRMLDTLDPLLMPVVVLRAADWVEEVRHPARYALATVLAADPGRYLPTALPMIVLTRNRRRGGFAHAQALAALMTAPQRARDHLLAAGAPPQRHLLLDLATAPDEVRLRGRAAEEAARRALWSDRPAPLLRWSRHARPEVREAALIALLRLGRTDEVAAHLDDRTPLVRAMARAAARSAGIDALSHYRQAVSATTVAEPSVGAIAGLAEIGASTDAALLRDLLDHPRSRVRAHAVRALRRMNAVPIAETVPLLRDASPAVVREATEALRHLTRAVPAGLAHELLTDPARTELRRAGYRLLRVRGAADQLRAALTLAVDDDPALARQARADATRLARSSSPQLRVAPEEMVVSPDEAAELSGLLARAAGALGPENTALLDTWIARSRG